MTPGEYTRRKFLQTGTTAGTGFALAFYLPGLNRLETFATTAAPFTPNAWILIGEDNLVTLVIDKSEMGQGVLTTLAMILADELDADWEKVRVETALATDKFAALRGGEQVTEGSDSVRSSWLPMREAAAEARSMLVKAAAQQWEADPSECRTEKGAVIHTATGRTLTYGALANAAAQVPIPNDPHFKEPKEYQLIGKPIPRIDAAAKTNGTAVFGIDVKLPKLLTAVVVRCPVIGGRVANFDANQARAVKGVRNVVQISNGVAVVADSYWAAQTGRKALKVRWSEGPNLTLSSDDLWQMFRDRMSRGGTISFDKGNIDTTGGHHTVVTEYMLPYVAHATMEPQNCTADVRSDGCEIWVPTQNQTAVLETAARITGLAKSAIMVHTTLLGGGFGRRSDVDYATEAIEISKQVGAPVKVIFTREDDFQHDFYRPASLHRLTGILDVDGWPIIWIHRLSVASVLARVSPDDVTHGVDKDALSGTGQDFPYTVANTRVVCCIAEDNPVPVGWWRGVGYTSTAFVTESFIDELARAGRRDPVELRRHMLGESPRLRAILDLAAEKSGWGTPLPTGHGRGVSLVQAFGSVIAQVAEVSVNNNQVRVHRVVCAVDCGRVVNPDTAEAQIAGGVAYGLSAALYGEITFLNGRVREENFNDYPVLRINEMPDIEVHFKPSEDPPGGVGALGVPPIAPAVANAIFAATGRRPRRLPIRMSESES